VFRGELRRWSEPPLDGVLSVPRAALRVAFGELSEALLDSRRVVPCRALEHGYQFTYSELEAALRACVGAERALRLAVALRSMRARSQDRCRVDY
jgi:hypothetical protein